jgi:hypothetical protein
MCSWSRRISLISVPLGVTDFPSSSIGFMLKYYAPEVRWESHGLWDDVTDDPGRDYRGQGYFTPCASMG